MNKLFGLLPLGSLLMLPACSYFDDTDPREGAETVEQCLARLASTVADFSEELDTTTAQMAYTYDITKLGLEELQQLTVPGSDETAGARLMAATNETSTAVARFKELPATPEGAFFMATDPALYRVLGDDIPVNQAVNAGCERQLPGMRLISVNGVFNETFDPTVEPPADDSGEAI
ncbi:MAG: hypothetical protein ABJN35_05560 [Erythrobacter sp.]